jgi:putative CocE/NonD family hydrolase
MIEQADVLVRMSDGVQVAVRIWRPDDERPAPTLFAASPYRYDNDDLPDTGIYLWHETGPIHWYVEHGFAYVHLDVRGTGKSGGDYGFFDRRERRDLFEVIEWIAIQPWCNGNVGGIGQSYYAASQWCMASERPPHLRCIAPYDGHVDICSGWAYTGGIPGAFLNEWWYNNVRPANRTPANGAPSRELPLDLSLVVAQHPTRDDFWRERTIHEALRDVDIPVYSIGVWAKLELHLAGNILGYERVAGPRKLLVSGVPSMTAALVEFESVAFHERVLLPFYERFLRGSSDDTYERRPNVEFAVRGTSATVAAEAWPPAAVAHEEWFLDPAASGTVTSLNDGSLGRTPAAGAPSTSYRYPDPEWTLGPVVFTRFGPDAVRRVLTFTSAPLADDLTIAGPAEIVLHVSSSRRDTDIIAKLSEQLPQSAAARATGAQPAATVVTKGWLRASHRGSAADDRIGSPVMLRPDPLPLVPG